MFKTYRLFGYSILMLLSFSLFSCSAIIKSTIKDDGVQMPADFGKDDAVILAVKSGGKRYNKTIEKVFAKSYKGKYLVITPGELYDTAYKDKRKYRYVFDNTIHSGIATYNTTTHSSGPSMGYMKFQVYDRLTNKTYHTKSGMSSYAKLMRLYLQVLDKKRIKENQPTTN